MILIRLAIAWLAGLVLADVFHLPLLPLVGLAIACGILACVCARSQIAQQVMLVLCVAAFGGARLSADQVQPTRQSVWLLNNQGNLVLDAVVMEDPQRSEDGQQMLVRALSAIHDGAKTHADGLVLIKLPAYPERHYGEHLRLTGTLLTPKEPKRPGEFDYRKYLARKHVFSLMKPTAVERVSVGNGSPFFSWLYSMRDTARRVLLRELPEPQASLAVGILLGIQSSIPDDIYNNFSNTGTSHILVISGWNISIIAAALFSLAGHLKLPKHVAFGCILATIWVYTLFVGASSTVIRAAIMGSIVVFGQWNGRQSHAWTTLFVACWIMTLINPQWLWDLGFQLSALATASLFAFGKWTEDKLNGTFLRAPWLDWAREALTATLAAQILALPLILYEFGNLSIVAPFANVALLPMVPYAMLFAAVALVVGFVWLPLGQLLAPVGYLFLGWLTEGARFFADLPWAAVQIPPFPLWVLLMYYVVVLAVRFVPWSTLRGEVRQAFPEVRVGTQA